MNVYMNEVFPTPPRRCALTLQHPKREDSKEYASLEQMIGRELLYLACRHHILEIPFRGVIDIKIGTATGPHRDSFKRFPTAWVEINKGKYDTGISDNLVPK